eukprot:m.610250 g.610250  ORF g.610250 m.610250 type:complete len:331 (+) comp58131_c0_seq16:77-1069(+)
MIDINRNIRTFAAGLLAVFVLFFLILSSGLHHSLEASGTGEEHIDLIELLSASINLAERGGRIVRSVREGGLLDQSSKGQTAEGADDPLTRADTTSHKEIVKARSARGLAAALRRRRSATPTEATSLPNKRLLPKLSPARVPMSEVTVWVDPLNVTQEFTENLLQYVTVLVCISNQGKPVGAVIHQPFPDGEGKVHTVYALSGVQGLSPLRGNSSSAHESSTARRVIWSFLQRDMLCYTTWLCRLSSCFSVFHGLIQHSMQHFEAPLRETPAITEAFLKMANKVQTDCSVLILFVGCASVSVRLCCVLALPSSFCECCWDFSFRLSSSFG